MTTQQPEALRLAEVLETRGQGWADDMAKELRRQHARIVELEAQLAAAQQAVQPFGWLITKSKLPGDVEFTQDPVRENLARSFGYQTQALYTHPTQQGMDAIAALQKVRDIAVSALLTGSLGRQDWIDDMDRIAAQAKQGG